MNNFDFSYGGDAASSKTYRQNSDTEYGLDYIFKSGPFAGRTLQERIDEKPTGVTWMIENLDFQLDNDAYQYYRDAIGDPISIDNNIVAIEEDISDSEVLLLPFLETDEFIPDVPMSFLNGQVLALEIDDAGDKQLKEAQKQREEHNALCHQQILKTDSIIWGTEYEPEQ